MKYHRSLWEVFQAMANYVFKLYSKCILCSPEKTSTTNLTSLSSSWKQANQRIMIVCVPCGTSLSKSLPGPVRAWGKQVMALGWVPKAINTIPQCTIQHQEKPCLIFSLFYPTTLFSPFSTSVHSPLIPWMFLPLPFFAPSPPWLLAKVFTDSLRSFFSPTWYLIWSHQVHNNSH